MHRRRNLSDELRRTPRERHNEFNYGQCFWGFKGDFQDSWGWGSNPCYRKHPSLVMPDTSLSVFGGNCGDPVVTDADVYVGFCSPMKYLDCYRPNESGKAVLFPVKDMAAPDNPKEFRDLIEWTKGQIDDEKKVHIGCVGGHGRTGTALAALVSLYGEQDAITYIRQKYCSRAVESSIQVEFLHRYFDVARVKGAKTGGEKSNTVSRQLPIGVVVPAKKRQPVVIRPIPGSRTIWG